MHTNGAKAQPTATAPAEESARNIRVHMARKDGTWAQRQCNKLVRWLIDPITHKKVPDLANPGWTWDVWFDRRLDIGDDKLVCRYIAHSDERTDGGTETEHLLCDESGIFYVVEWLQTNSKKSAVTLVQQVSGKMAMHWINERFVKDNYLKREFARAIDSPTFEFMPLVAVTPKPKRARKAKAKTEEKPFAVQMEMVTGLVSVVAKLAENPGVELLSEAQRRVSALHQILHSTETFKRAASF